MRRVLVTGATGVLGSALVPFLLNEHSTEVLLLLRASNDEAFAQKVDGWLNEFDLHFPQLRSQRLRFVRGDTSRENLGLADIEADELSQSVTHIIHAAGSVKLNQSLSEARNNAVQSAKFVIDFGRRCQNRGLFRKLEFVSTVGVGGKEHGILKESRVLGKRVPEDFHNSYEAAKWEAEKLIWEIIDEGFPVTIHRPSMIVGDSQTGKVQRFQVFYYLLEFLMGIHTLGVVPSLGDARLDIVPVDYVANAICLASRQEIASGEVLHLCSGAEGSWKLTEIASRAHLLFCSSYDLPLPQFVPMNQFKVELPRIMEASNEKSRRFLAGLPFFWEYLDTAQAFDNVKSTALLSIYGLELPSVSQYFDRIVEYFRKHSNHS